MRSYAMPRVLRADLGAHVCSPFIGGDPVRKLINSRGNCQEARSEQRLGEKPEQHPPIESADENVSQIRQWIAAESAGHSVIPAAQGRLPVGDGARQSSRVRRPLLQDHQDRQSDLWRRSEWHWSRQRATTSDTTVATSRSAAWKPSERGGQYHFRGTLERLLLAHTDLSDFRRDPTRR